MKKTLSIILCIAMLMSSISICFPAFAIDVDFGVESAKDLAIEAVPEAAISAVSFDPISVSAYGGKTEDVDPRYPGAYFTFDHDVEINPASVTKTNMNNASVKYVDYDAATKTFILYQDAKNMRAGMTVSFEASEAHFTTVGGETVNFNFPAFSYKLAEHVNTGDNLLPYGDAHSNYPGMYTDSTYTATVDKENAQIISRTTSTQNNLPVFMALNIPFESGAAYRVNFYVRLQKANKETVSFYVNPSWYYDGSAHTAERFQMSYNDTETLYKKTFETTIGTLNNRTGEMAFRLATNTPIKVNGKAQQNPTYALTDISAYQRLDVVYSAGDYCELDEDASELSRVEGVYLDGSAESTQVSITGEMPYVTTDSRWFIDEDKPWIDQDGKEYAAGVVDLAVANKTLYLTPNVKTNENLYTLTFESEGLLSAPNALKVFENETVDLTPYNNMKSAITGKRFGGWLDEKGKVVNEVVMTKNITLTPNITVNYDFAYEDSYTGTGINTVSAANYKYYEGNMIGAVNLTAGQDAYLSFGNFELATAKYSGLKVWFDAYSKPETAAKYVPSFAAGLEGLYVNTDKVVSASMCISGANYFSGKLVSENGKQYLVVTIDGAKSSLWNGTLHFMRLDPPNGMPDWAIRRIEFIENEMFDESVIMLENFKSIESGDIAPVPYDANGIADVKSVEWTPALLGGNIINADTTYSAKVVLGPKAGAGKIFNNDTCVMLGGRIVPMTMVENSEITLNVTFPKTASAETYTVTFDSTGITGAPAATTGFAGKLFPTQPYLSGISVGESGKRFIGWSTKPGCEHFSESEEYVLINGDTVLYPVIGYDFNFAVPGFVPASSGYSLEYLYQDKYLKVNASGKDHAVYINTDLPAYLIKRIRVFYDGKYFPSYPDTIYYQTTNNKTWNESKSIRFDGVKNIDDASGYVYYDFNPSDLNYMKDKIVQLRFDVFLNTYEGDPAYVRAMEFQYNDVIDADTVHFAGIPAPVAGLEDTTASKIQIGDDYASFDHVEWTPALSTNQTTVGRFKANTHYTATVFFKSAAGMIFNSNGMKVYNSATDETVDAEFNQATGLISASFDMGTTGSYNPFGMTIVGSDYYLVDGKDHTYKVVISGNPLDKKFAVEYSVPNGQVSDYAVCLTDTLGNPVINVKKPCELTIKAISAYNPDVTAELTVTTECMEFDAHIEGPSSIGKASRLTQYKMVTVSEEPIYDTTATWSVDDESIATIDAKTGKLVPSANGTVTITAVSNYDSSVSCTKTVEITNQAAAGLIVYNPGTQNPGDVTGLPADQPAYGTVALSDVIPVRDGYSFLGWADSDESFKTVSEVTVQSEQVVNVYAVWAKGIFYNFNGDKNGVSGFSVGGKNEQIHDTYWSYQNNANDTRFTMSVDLDPKVYRTVQIRMATDASSGSSKIYYKGVKDGVTYGFDANSYANAENMSLTVNNPGDGIDSWFTLNFDFYNSNCGTTPATWHEGAADKITRMDFQLAQARPGAEVRIDYIAILDSSAILSFNKNTSDEVINMPAEKLVGQGDEVQILETPYREGYKFMGWSKDPSDRSNLKTKFTIVGDVTLYAIWDKTVDPENEDEDGETVVKTGDIDPDTDGEVILVGTNAGKNVKVTFSYEDNGGDIQTITAVTNAKGYAIIDLSGIADKAYDGKLSINSSYKFTEVTVTDADTAKTIANKVDPKPKPDSGNGGYTPPSSNVTDVKSDKQLYDPEVMNSKEEGGVTFVDALTMSKEEGDILYNFDSEKNSDLFNSYRQVSMNGISDSVLHLTANGLKSGSNDSPAFTTCNLAVNADNHKYIVVKAKQSGLSNKSLRIYFQEEGGKFAEAKALSQNIGDSYSMMVYDMSSFAEWKGTITRFMFSFNGDVKGDCDIDWILFTNEVPASMDDIEGTHEMFPDVVTGEFPFTDVKNSDWFYPEVNNAYRKGFIKGMTDTTYEPDGNVTIAEAITMAIRLNYAFNGKKDDIKVIEGAEWYPNYVNAAVKAGIIKNNQFAEYDVPALRKDVAIIMYKAVPSSYLTSINMFTSIPDCDKKDSAYSAILKLYNAGVVQGSDAEYNFYPNTNITRAEMAAILNRIALPQNRKRIVTEAEKEAKKIKIYADDLVTSAPTGNCEATKLVMKNGAAWAMAKTKDPIVYLTNLLPSLNGKEVQKIHVGMKWDASKIANPTSAGCRIFFTTPSGSWAESRSLKSAWDGKLDASGVADIVFDATANAEFANTITAIRFDPFDSINEFAIAYVIVE